ncbi:MAG: LPXTG cell wall anchor domain-containing protein [Lachnospiraceae bacterium]|nr:LPXTG cell wall anchor domain-containing protein [Lachnospiraceae bacterium]
MVRTLKVSHKKLLAFFIAFAVALLTIGGVLPSIAKARPAGDIADVEITLGTMPEVGKTAGSVMEDNDISFVTDGTQAIEEIDSIAISMHAWSEESGGYLPMDPDDVFEKDGDYKLMILMHPEDAAKIAENPYVTINGLHADWDISNGHFYMEFEFSTVNYDSDGGTEVASESVIMGTLFTEPAEPTKEGYEFRGWWFDDELYPDREGWYVFTNEPENLAEITLTAKWAEVVDDVVLDGDNQTFYLESGNDVSIRWNMNYNYFYYLELLNTSTGEYVVPENGVDYEVKEGSTIITFNNSFLKTLAAGKYEVKAWFNDGNDNVSVATATLTVNEGAAPATTPATGDNANIAAFVSIGLVAIAGIATVVFVKRRVNE